MTEEFWKKKYYDSLNRQKEIKIGQSVNLAQNELLQTCDDAKQVLEQIEEKSIKYYELLEKLTNKLVVSEKPEMKEVKFEKNKTGIIIPKIQ